MATEQGTVVKTDNGVAVVKTRKSEACAGCASRNACNAMGNDVEVEALNRIGAKQGDDVVLQIQTRPFLKATFILYLFPILCMMAGAMAGEKLAPAFDFDKSVLSAILAFASFFISIWIVKAKGKEMGKKEEYRPKIIRILKPATPASSVSEGPEA